jgi:glycosyltransferase involved in cell wall biosynthesis
VKILFVHQNFPGQFKFLAPALAKRGHQVTAMTMQKVTASQWSGVNLVPYAPSRGSTPGVHPWVSDFETKVIRGDACFRAAMRMREQGYVPDVVVAHPGWGETLFLKEVWPNAKLAVYCEFFYSAEGTDVGFDPEFPVRDIGEACRIKLKNLNNFLHFDIADAGISPTQWQASTFPEPFRSKISVIHDGIDTQALTPKPDTVFEITTPAGAQLRLTRNDQVITFVNRNLEPYRGYHTFMRALPEILRQNAKAVVLIVGGDGVSYGAKPPGEKTWKEIFRAEVENQIADKDWARVHYLGNIAYSNFVTMLQISSTHVYLTYPFVLSWSLLEAMSVGCAIVASNTAPLREAIVDQQTGRLVDFFDHVELARTVSEVLANPSMREVLGKNARAFACAHYDLQTVCLPRQLQWVEQWAR